MTPGDRAYLRQFLEERFSMTELQVLAFDLGVDYETLPHASKFQFSMELISYLEHRDSLGSLLAKVLEQRPDQQLAQILTEAPTAHLRVKLQISLELNEVDVARLLKYLAEQCRVDPGEISLVGVAPRPFRLLVSLPTEAADGLIETATSLSRSPYHITNITHFEQLDMDSQAAWQRRVIGPRVRWPTLLALVAVAVVVLAVALLVWRLAPEATPVIQSFSVHHFNNQPAQSLKPGALLEIAEHEQVNVQAVIYDQVGAVCAWQAIHGLLHTAQGCSITYSAPLGEPVDELTVVTYSPRRTVEAYASLHVRVVPASR